MKKSSKQRIVDNYWSFFPILPLITYHQALAKQFKDCHSILDIGCGHWSPIRYHYFDRAVGVDLDPGYIKQAKQNRTNHEYYLVDVRTITTIFQPKSFDVCVSLDLIEHLTKKDGLQLIKNMEKLAKKRIVIFTPQGYMHQEDTEHPLQDHQSGWTAEEMEQLGFKVTGIFGPKWLRGDQHVLKGNKVFSGILSEIIQFFYTHNHPQTAAAIFCVKECA